MRCYSLVALFLFISFAWLSPGAEAFPIHKDETYGYKITPPKNWTSPTREDSDTSIIATFNAKKYTYFNSPEGWTWKYKPSMTVIAFVHDQEKVKAEGNTITFRNRYKDYKDFLKSTHHGGGYYFSKEEESDVKDVPVTCYEVKIEKLSSTGPRLIIAWVYHLEDLDIAVQFEILEKSYAKMRGDIMRSLKSFRAIERTGDPVAASAGNTFSLLDLENLSIEERNERRKELEKEAHDKALEDLPKGWKRSKVGDMLVLDSYNPGMAKKIALQCRAIYNWLDDNFDFVGPGEYVRAPILKVYKADDANSLNFRFSFGLLNDIIIEYEHNPGWLREMNFEMVNQRALELWFMDRDRDLYWAMPHWMKHGLDDLFRNARGKGKRLEFQEDIHDSVRLNQALSQGALSNPRDLMLMGREKFYSGRYKGDEASAWVRYLLVGPGSKSRKTKTVFRDYLVNLAQVTAEIKKEEKEARGKDSKPTTEEEENEYFQKEQNAWKDKENRILEETFKRTFSEWKDSTWKSVTAAYMKMVD